MTRRNLTRRSLASTLLFRWEKLRKEHENTSPLPSASKRLRDTLALIREVRALEQAEAAHG